MYTYRKPTLVWVLIAVNIVLFMATAISPQIKVSQARRVLVHYPTSVVDTLVIFGDS